MKLRPYQQAGIEQIREHYRKGHKRVILHLATGGGKTVCFSYMLGQVAKQGKKAIMVVRGKELVDQASKRLFDCGIDNHGVLQGNHWNRKPNAPIQVCSIDTLRSRDILPDADLVVIDECQNAKSPSFKKLLEHEKYKNSFFISVSATPHVKGGMGFLATKVVHPISVKELIAQGYLVKPRYFSLPSAIDKASLKFDKKTNDYTTASMADAVDRANILGDAIEHYKKLGEGRPAIYFAVSVAASQKAASDFNSAGVRAEHLDANSTDAERKEVIARLKSGETKVVTNCGILTTGVDIPCVGVIILARPTASYNLYIQMVGRGTRPYEGKKDFIVLDHAINVPEHGFIEDERECSLDDSEPNDKNRMLVTCEACYSVFDPSETGYVCTAEIGGVICGHDNSKKQKENEENLRKLIVDKDAELVEIKDSDRLEKLKTQIFIESKIEIIVKKKFRAGKLFYYLKGKYGEEKGKSLWNEHKKYIFKTLAEKGWTEPPKSSRQFSEGDHSSIVENGTLSGVGATNGRGIS
jgi:superfamily II DNA or RNA helicase